LGAAALTLMRVLDGRAEGQGDQVAYIFLRDGDAPSGSLTFRQLRHRALSLAAQLSLLNARGERAILLYPQGLEFVVAFFGCLYAGVVAVPANLPNRKVGLEILRRMAADSGATLILSTGTFLAQFRADIATDTTLGRLSCLDTEAPVAPIPGSWVPPVVEPSGVALLQYTSGSTGSPRGVSVTHANLMINQRQIQLCLGGENRLVSWLPMFHDMGLGTVLQATWSGGSCVLMSPHAFLQDPLRWPRAVATYRGTVSGAPDFAFDLCARRARRDGHSSLDLSSWKVAYNGSEPVRAATLERFAETFASSGFRREAFHPLYGLAEATLLVSSEGADRPPLIKSFSARELALGRGEPIAATEPSRALVSCGHAWAGTEIAIVNPTTRERCNPGSIGEIWVRGESVAAGYFGKEAETERIFRAKTADGAGPFLRTGDLGFLDEDHLFVTGRLKDLIIVRGRNHYPQDIEASVSTCHPALVPNGCAAFSIDSADGERVVVIQEVARTALRTLDVGEVVRAIRRAVSEDHALHTHAVVLVKPSTLLRTSSGKVRHDACRAAFIDHSLVVVASWAAPTTPEPDTDAGPDSDRREVSARADQLIEWLRRHAADLIGSYSTEGQRTVPAPLLRSLAQQGLLGMQVDSQYGGLGLSHSDTARVIEQLAAFDFALALFIGLNNYLGIQPVAKYAGSQMKALLLPGLAQGRELAAFALEEPGSGKRPDDVTTQANPDGEERWRLFGTKYLEGVTQGSTIINVFVRHEEPPGMSAFIVSEGIAGLRQLRDGLSMGVLGFTRETIVLDGVRVGRENLLASLGSGVEIAQEARMHGRLAIGAACVGGMKRCVMLARSEGPYHGTINGKLTPNPLTLSRLGSVTARVAALECLVQRTARAVDAGHAVPAEAFAACRVLGPELLLRTVDDLMQLGVTGDYAETNRILCLYRDAGLLRNFDGPPEGIAEVTGAAFMDEDASLRLLLQDVFGAPDLVRWIGPTVDAVRHRMTKLRGALASRAERWGHTRAGELTMWLTLLAAVEGTRRFAPSTEVERAHNWALTQFEEALASVRFGTPSESAALDASDVAATFAACARSIGTIETEALSEEPGRDTPASAPRIRRAERASTSTKVPSPERESVAREMRSWIVSWLAHRLQIPVTQVEPGRSFADHGLDSVASVELAKALSDRLGRDLDETLLWNFSTIEALVEYLVGPRESSEVDSWTESGVSPTPRSAAHPDDSVLEEEIARLEAELKSRS
jgi:acyl-CoA synthetase (AMP-forming)/AMP-acid ligase II/alkylation response protein AidB-like acyl-CoA dehydrogenase/acyl carrier protein